MKVLLVNPPLSGLERKNPVRLRLFSNAMPLGICYLAAYLGRAGIDVDIIDGAATGIDLIPMVESICRLRPDVMGITSTSVSFHRAVELAESVKKKLGSDFPIVLGGAHLSAVPLEAMAHECFDYGVYGEGEETFTQLVSALGAGRGADDIPGVYYRQEGKILFTSPRPLITNLDAIPFPRRNLLNTSLYTSLPTDVRRLPKFSILANRGCPFNCIFCDSAVVGKSYRTASPGYLADEMEMLKKDFGAREIFFVGTTFTVSREHTEAFLSELERRRLDMMWTCSTRVDVVDLELLSRMKKAGCWAIRFGIESGSQKVLDFIRKGINLDQARKAVEDCARAGINAKAFFMVGHLNDTRETIRESIDFAKSLPLTDLTVQINTPLPNTEQFRRAKEFGTLDTRDYSRYSFFEPVFTPHGMTPEELVSLQRQFYREFFWRPAPLIRQAQKLLNWNTFRNYIKCADLIYHLTLKR